MNIVLTEIRHSIVHSNGHFSKDKTKSWTDFQQTLLKELFTGKESKQEIIISTYNNDDYLFRIIAQHEQLIYDRIKKILNN